MAAFIHVHTHSAFSFGDGSSGVEELTLSAAKQGMDALALTDTMSLSGIPSLTKRCAKAGVKPLGGCEIILEGGARLTLLADGPLGFASLCRILSAAYLRDPKREGARVRWEDLETNSEGVVCLTGAGDGGLLPRLARSGNTAKALSYTDHLIGVYGRENLFIEVTRTLTEGEYSLSLDLLDLAHTIGLPVVATNSVRHADKMGMAPHECLRRVALHLAPFEEHGELPLNAERYLKSGEAMARLFPDRPDALENATHLAERLEPPLDSAVRHLPRFPKLPPGESAFSYLSALVWQGAKGKYKDQAEREAVPRLMHELEVIRDLGYCDYFLVCWDVCNEARRRQIGFALRGSSVGSAVAYCLGMSPHDPIARRISFERFLSKARRKPPDIDIDFRHDERDHIMEYTRKTYGEDRVGGVANYVCWKGRSLLRDLGKVLGFTGGEIDRLRELLWHSKGDDLAEELEGQPELRALGIDGSRYADLFALCATLAGLPRHLGTHCSGLVVSDAPLAQVCPVLWAAKGVTIAAFDKDDVEAPGIGLLKMDQLCLRALTAVDIAVSSVRQSDPTFDYDNRDREDAETLAMIRAAETIGVFQLDSPAQMSLQWRLQAEKFDDLIASVALIRPGPLVGKTVEPYIAGRKGWQPVTYPLPELEPILRDTYGRIIFQDQVLDVVTVVGGYAPEEGDAYLKTMTHARSQDEMERLGQDLWQRAKTKGMKRDAFQRLWKQIKGFSRYGFCEGHAVAFASHAQGTAYLLRHHPAEFLAGVLSVEPCGFWPIATVAEEAKRRGVKVLPPCLNCSDARQWAVTQKGEEKSIRCSLTYVKVLGTDGAEAILTERGTNGPFTSLVDAGRRLAFLPRDAMEWLTLSGAMDTLCGSRRKTLWSLPALHHPPGKKTKPAPGQEAMPMDILPSLPANIPDFTEQERFHREWQALGFSPHCHPMRFFRAMTQKIGAITCAELQQTLEGAEVTITGLALRPHRPPTPSGQVFVFFTLEDESGLAQVTVTPDIYQKCGQEIFAHPILAVKGDVEKRGAGMILRAIDVCAL